MPRSVPSLFSSLPVLRFLPVRARALLAVLIFLSISTPTFGHGVAEGDSSGIVVHVVHEGRPVAGAEVYRLEWKDRYRDGVSTAAARIGQSDGDGAVSVPVRMLHGRVLGGIQILARGTGDLAGFTRISIFSDPDSVVVHLFPSRTVSGVVRDDRGGPIRDAEITIWNIIGNETTEYEQIDLYGTTPGSSAKSDAHGRFTLTGIPESSRINIFAAAPGKATLCVRDIPSGMNTLDIRLEPESRITGRVTLGNGEPVKGLYLELQRKLYSPWSESEGPCRTDSSGAYAFEHLCAGMYMVRAYPDSTLRDWIAPSLENIGVGRGKTASHADITLVRGIPLTGMVVEEESGEPVPGVRVSASLIVSNPSDHNGVLHASLGFAWSDAKGIYRLPALPGDVQVSAIPPEGYADNVRWQRVAVEPQDSLVRGVNLTVARGKTIRGVVKLPDGSPASEAEIFCGFFTSAYTDEKGSFEINGIRSGGKIPYFAFTRKRDMEASFTINVDSASVAEVVLHSAEFVSMEGVVVDSEEKPVPGVQVKLQVMEDASPIKYGPASATTDSNGRFRMDRIRAGHPCRFVVQDGLAGSDVFLAGKDAGPLRITLPRTDGWLEGIARDAGGKPLAGMKVYAWGERGNAQTVTGDDGRFRMEGLVSGKMELTFRGAPGYFRFRDVETNRRRDFVLSTGRHYLAGLVTDLQNKPLAGALVTIARKEKGERPIAVETDSGGRFYLSNLELATATITVSGPGLREQTLRVRTNREDVRFRLGKAGEK